MDKERSENKLSWPELKAVVSDLRRQLSSLSTMVPTSITFRTLQDGRTRIYFLSTPQNTWENTLLCADIPNGNQPTSMRLQWQCVIESNFPTISTADKYSREEQLIRERKRLTTWGINSYEIHSDSGKIIFPAAGSLFQCIDSGYSWFPVPNQAADDLLWSKNQLTNLPFKSRFGGIHLQS
ncbi:unnamed protein product [Callosobruchus maculatus]|uniref:Dipeptidyl peptidase 8 /9,N-terminal domain-containing protein n=1 Tax=Callosobruchus maculatus TaxID=64391 RepID=A0A653CVT2_CALMS|nr:unnamed protein product [Callosobruchus maculatus]